MSDAANSPSEHAKLSPSASDRWLACPASIARLPADYNDEGSEAAHEGTAAHAFAESCLRTGTQPTVAPFPEAFAKYDSPQMRMHVQTYFDYVMRLMVPGAELFVEQRLEIFKQYEVFGTADAIVVTPDGVIHVIDLKYGEGILVSVEDNTQLLLYAVGGMAFDWLCKVPVNAVAAHIVQPRRNSLVSKTYSIEQLAQWVSENIAKVARAHAGTNEAVPGSHCQWCPMKGPCRERAEMNLKLASFDFADEVPCCAAKESLTELELVTIFLAIPSFRKWLDSIEAEVAGRAHKGPVPGLKWVAGRNARKILDPEMAATALAENGIEPYSERKLKGITEIEDALKLKGLTVAGVLGKLVEKLPGKPALVGAADKREAITPLTAAKEDFA